MRVAHFTDIHLLRRPALTSLLGKRLLGAANLYLAGRAGHFQEATVVALVEAIAAQEPDVVVCTGDFTALASPSEFALARDLLEPLISRFPFVAIPGNHDVYTREAILARSFERTFGRWSGGGTFPAVHHFGDVAFVGVDGTRAHPLLASGRVPEAQLQRLDQLLRSDELADTFVVLLVHYPLRDRTGAPDLRKARHLENGLELVRIISETGRVGLVLHGHEHHGFRTEIATPRGPVPIINPGASGLATLPASARTAHFNVYTLGRQGLEGVERFALLGPGFVPEPGGPYASGG